MNDKKNRRETITKLFEYIKRYRALMIFSLILAALIVVLTLYIPIIVGKAIDLIIDKGNVKFDVIGKLFIKIGIIAAVTAFLQWVMNTVNNKITYNITRDVRNEAFEKIEILPIKYIDSHSHGDVVSRVIADVDQFADGLLMGFSQLFTGVMTIIVTLFFMLSLNVKIALLVVLLTPLSLFVARYISKHTYDMFKKRSEVQGKQTAFINEIIGNQKIVKAFSREEASIKQFEEINERLEKYSLSAIFYSSLTNPCTRFINSVIYAAVGLAGAISAIMGGLSIGGLSCFLSYANQYTKPFNEISGVITELQNALASAGRIFELIEESPEIPDDENAVILENVSGNIVFDNVSFSYTKDKKLIKSLDLSVKQGQRVAIVGPTGCGKTTLINLLMRFYDTDNGSISVDGIKIKEIKRGSLRKNYGMVLQDTWLKNGTVRDNITMGKPDATEEEILSAAKASHAHSFIKRLPNGYDTYISEDGGNLSKGQKQLLCITRVMLCHPPMLILDEATSSIDTRTELKIQKAFENLMKGKTSFIVAHRLSTIKEADMILVMKDGDIIEKGNHVELMKNNGFYSHLYNSQFEK